MEEHEEIDAKEEVEPTEKVLGCPHCKFSLKDEDKVTLENILPPGYYYIICSFKRTTESGFDCDLHMNLLTDDEAETWCWDFQTQSLSTFRVEKTASFNGTRVLLKKIFRCYHKLRYGKRITDCPAKITVRLSKAFFSRKDKLNEGHFSEIGPQGTRSKDMHMPDTPFFVSLNFNHNHPLNTADVEIDPDEESQDEEATSDSLLEDNSHLKRKYRGTRSQFKSIGQDSESEPTVARLLTLRTRCSEQTSLWGMAEDQEMETKFMEKVLGCPRCIFTLKDEDKITLEKILPAEYHYFVCSFKRTTENGFDCVLHMNLFTEEEVETWYSEFQTHSLTTFRVLRTAGSTGTRILLKKMYRCVHRQKLGTRKLGKANKRNTDCPAQVTMRLAKAIFCRRARGKLGPRGTRSKDKHMPDTPLLVNLNFNHNHPLDTTDVLKFRDVGPRAEEAMTKLLLKGYSPAAALETYKYDLKQENPRDYVRLYSDRYHCPDSKWCYRLYYKIFKEMYGTDGIPPQKDLLEKAIQDYNKEISLDSSCPAVAYQVKDNTISIAVCTPLMRRVHEEVCQSGELVFVDSSMNKERQKCGGRVFVLLTHSVCGDLPLGVLILSSDTTANIASGLNLYNGLLNDSSFGGRGIRGPVVFMTENLDSLRNALNTVYAQSKFLLCTFHVLREFWSFLCDSKNEVKSENRFELFSLIKDIMHADSVYSAETNVQRLDYNYTLRLYPNVQKYITSWLERRQEWILCFRSELPVRGSITNRFCENSMRVVKSTVLKHSKAPFNFNQLLHFILTRLETHYSRRLENAANDQLDPLEDSKPTLGINHNINLDTIIQADETGFLVPIDSCPNVHYQVDLAAGYCTCPEGFVGGTCKHQAAVAQKVKVISCHQSNIVDPATRQKLLYISTGRRDLPTSATSELNDRRNNVVCCSDEGETTENIGHLLRELESEEPAASQPSKEQILRDQCQIFGNRIMDLYKSNPSCYETIVERFFTAAHNLKTDSDWESALSSFGNCSASKYQRMSTNAHDNHLVNSVEQKRNRLLDFKSNLSSFTHQ